MKKRVSEALSLVDGGIYKKEPALSGGQKQSGIAGVVARDQTFNLDEAKAWIQKGLIS